jgi:hypothetical protein
MLLGFGTDVPDALKKTVLIQALEERYGNFVRVERASAAIGYHLRFVEEGSPRGLPPFY